MLFLEILLRFSPCEKWTAPPYLNRFALKTLFKFRFGDGLFWLGTEKEEKKNHQATTNTLATHTRTFILDLHTVYRYHYFTTALNMVNPIRFFKNYSFYKISSAEVSD